MGFLSGPQPAWDDLLPNGADIGLGPAAPSFSVYNGNLRAYEYVGAATMKEIHFGFQLPHAWWEGTAVHPHIHLYIPNDAIGGNVRFGFEYTWTNIGSVGAVGPTTVYCDFNVAANAGIQNNALYEFEPALSGTGKTLSSMIMCRLFRDPTVPQDTFGSSIWLKSIDLHIQKDAFGSRYETVK